MTDLDKKTIIGFDMLVDNPELKQFMLVWIKAALVGCMAQAGIKCEITADGNNVSVDFCNPEGWKIKSKAAKNTQA
jgi:hypothetical protein